VEISNLADAQKIPQVRLGNTLRRRRISDNGNFYKRVNEDQELELYGFNVVYESVPPLRLESLNCSGISSSSTTN